jgi:pimeloyl-ACP methyl ester carboxylesterase
MNLILVHGFMGSALNWGPCKSLLEKKAQTANLDLNIFSFDLLGHANKSLSAHQSSAQDLHQVLSLSLLEDIERLIHDLEKIPTIALGHSFGLRPLLLLSKEFPELFSHLIVEDASPELRLEGYSFLKKLLETTPAPFRTREDAKSYFETNYGEGALSRFFLSNIRAAKEGIGADWRFDKGFLLGLLEEAKNTPLWEEWKSFKGESALIYGEKSESLNLEEIQKMTQLRSPKALHSFAVPDSGHWVHSEKLEPFVDLVFDLLLKVRLSEEGPSWA